MKKITGRQKEVLDFIRKEIMYKNYPPSVREICQALNLNSSSTVHAHLKALQKKGYIKRDPAKPRAIKIIDPASLDQLQQKAVPVPLLGKVTAGTPVLAEENIESYMFLPSEIVKSDTIYLLRVQGDSMKDAGILPEDLVIVRRQPTAENGEIVVALLDDEATVKRLYREKDYIRLQPENPAYQPLRSKNVVILGKVIGLLRTFE